MLIPATIDQLRAAGIDEFRYKAWRVKDKDSGEWSDWETFTPERKVFLQDGPDDWWNKVERFSHLKNQYQFMVDSAMLNNEHGEICP